MTGGKSGKDPSVTEPPARLGPRPLLLHLATAFSTLASSHGALALSRSGSQPWRGPLGEASELLTALASADHKALDRAVAREAGRRFGRFVEGIEAYRKHSYRRRLSEPPCIWQDGSARLLDYASTAKGHKADPPLLVVPSLINRYWVLDLSERISFLRWLAAQGLSPYVVDWGAPEALERSFSLSDYIAGRLEAALSAILARGGPPPVLIGYCMGGDLALALALRRQRDLAGLVLLATPWDFHAVNAEQAQCLGAMIPACEPLMALTGELPLDSIQTLFTTLDPLQVMRKFSAFARLDPESPEAEAFVALEDWLNDGVPLAAPVARECLGGWYGHNTTATGHWRIAGEAVKPEGLELPCLVVVPERDRIVPPASAAALAVAIPGAQRLTPGAGHIGLVVGRRAPATAWRQILTWLKALPTERR